jgi:hypothetical protein
VRNHPNTCNTHKWCGKEVREILVLCTEHPVRLGI